MADKKLDILLIANYWHFEEEKASSRYRSFADILCQYYNLEVITSTFCHLTKKQRILAEIDLEKLPYKVTLQRETGYRKNVSLKRIISYGEFGRNVLSYLKQRKKPDIVIVSVPSLSVADYTTKYCRQKGIPVIVDIQDLWPEAFKMALNVPVISDIIFYPMMCQANRIYSRANEIMAVSDTYVLRGKECNPNCRGMSIYIGTDSTLVEEKTKGVVVKKNNSEFWIGYVGALGHSYDIKTVIDALDVLEAKGYKNIVFKVMGEGVLKKQFEEYAKVKNVKCDFMGLLEYGVMMKTLMACDVAVNPIIDRSVSSIINKVSDYAAAAMPVINTQNSLEYRKLLEEFHAGINVENGDCNELAKAIKRLYDDEKLRKNMSENAHMLFYEKFDRRKNYCKLVDTIERIIK